MESNGIFKGQSISKKAKNADVLFNGCSLMLGAVHILRNHFLSVSRPPLPFRNGNSALDRAKITLA